MRISISSFILIALVLCGCEKSPEQEHGAVDVWNGDPHLVLAHVGNVDVTLADFQRRLQMETALWELKYRKVDDKKRAETIKRLRKGRFKKILPTLVNGTLIGMYAHDRKIHVTDAERLETANKLIAAIGIRGDVASVAKATGIDERYLLEQLSRQTLIIETCRELHPNNFVVSKQEIKDGLDRLDRYYEGAIASNAVKYAAASNLLYKIRTKKLDFADAGMRFGEGDATECAKWDDFAPSELDDAEYAKLKRWAFSAPIGAMRIFDLDDGLCIVKILSRKGGVSPVVSKKKDDSEVSLARILFKMIVPEPEPRTEEYVRKTLLDWKSRNAQKGLFDELMKKYPVTFHEEIKLTLKD